MSCSPQELIAAAKCYACLSPGEWNLVIIALLCRIREGTVADCDPATLIAEAKCFACIPAGQQQLAIISLLCNISQEGSLLAECDSVSESVANQVLSDWNQQTTTNVNWCEGAWSPELGIYVAVSFTAGTGNQVMYSYDGLNWTVSTSAANKSWRNVVWADGLNGGVGAFVAIARDTISGGNQVMTSTNGITWTSRTHPENNNWLGITWSKDLGLLVAVAASGTNRVMTSTDGATWVAVSCPLQLWFNVIWAKELGDSGLFVAVAFGGSTQCVMTSPDGSNWTAQTTPNQMWRDVAWSKTAGLLVAVAESGTGNRVMTSPDGAMWTSGVSAADNDWTSVLWICELGLYVAMAENNQGVMSSPDGLAWTSRTAGVNNVSGMVWSPQLRQLVGIGGAAANRIEATTPPPGSPVIQVYSGTTDPPTFVPLQPNLAAQYTETAGGVQYTWNPVTQAWI